jgi:hypothetical protein
MTTDGDAIRRFFRAYAAAPVGPTPTQPNVPAEADEDQADSIDRTIEEPERDWEPLPLPKETAKEGEFPTRFIDGSQAGQPVLCVRAPHGWPIPFVLSEVGAVAIKTVGRGFEREFRVVERVLSFVADPFPWQEVEAFADALVNKPELRLRVLPANMPDLNRHSPFDYEVVRKQAYNRAQQEMTTLERLALAADTEGRPTLLDGPINRVMGNPKPDDPLLIGVAKSQASNYLHPQGWQTLLGLLPDRNDQEAQRTPVFRISGTKEFGVERTPVASWYVKLAGGPQLAPNWGYVRVEVPWGQFARRVKLNDPKDFGFVNRLSRWLVDARCRTDSYARMPVSLDPIVRAEDALKPLFTSVPVLVNRLYRTAGLFRGNEL